MWKSEREEFTVLHYLQVLIVFNKFNGSSKRYFSSNDVVQKFRNQKSQVCTLFIYLLESIIRKFRIVLRIFNLSFLIDLFFPPRISIFYKKFINSIPFAIE